MFVASPSDHLVGVTATTDAHGVTYTVLHGATAVCVCVCVRACYTITHTHSCACAMDGGYSGGGVWWSPPHSSNVNVTCGHWSTAMLHENDNTIIIT